MDKSWPWEEGKGLTSPEGEGHELCQPVSPLVSRGAWEPGLMGRSSAPGSQSRTGPPDSSSRPWAALQGGSHIACHTPPGKHTSEGILLAISEHESQMSDVLVMLFQSWCPVRGQTTWGLVMTHRVSPTRAGCASRTVSDSCALRGITELKTVGRDRGESVRRWRPGPSSVSGDSREV